MIDLIRDGVERPGKDSRRTYQAAVKTAMSACQRGWTYADWHALMLEPGSELGRQMARQRPQVNRSLRQAWERAIKRVAESPAMTEEQARDLADALERLLDVDSLMDSATRLVLQHAVDLARLRGTRRVALPWRAICEDTGLSEAVVKRVLSQSACGHLQLAERGRPGLNGRATLYWLKPPTSPVPGRCVGGSGAAAAEGLMAG